MVFLSASPPAYSVLSIGYNVTLLIKLAGVFTLGCCGCGFLANKASKKLASVTKSGKLTGKKKGTAKTWTLGFFLNPSRIPVV